MEHASRGSVPPAAPPARRPLWAFLFPDERRFLELLAAQADLAVAACRLLHARGTTAAMADLEQRGDAARRELVTALAGTYATPLDRDDIFSVSGALDDVVDTAQDALLTIAVFGASWSGHAEEMARAVAESADSLRQAVAALPRPAARAPARKARRFENVVSALYRYGVDLAIREREPAEAMRLREVYAALRDVARAVARAADAVADVAVKEK